MTVGERQRRPSGRPTREIGLAALLGLALALLVGACGATAPSSSPSGGATAATAPGESGSPRPKPTTWPTTTVEASIALGAADGDFTTLANDVIAAVNSEDPLRMLQVMTDAITFLEGNQKNIPRLQAYPATKDLGDRLAVVYAQMIDGAHQVVDGIGAADGAAIQAGFAAFFDGNKAYVALSPEVGDIAEQALFMKRQLLR